MDYSIYLCLDKQILLWETGTKHRRRKRKRRRKIRQGKISLLAVFFFNLAQVSFTILVLGLLITLTKEELYNNYFLMLLSLFGIVLTILFARIGNNILK